MDNIIPKVIGIFVGIFAILTIAGWVITNLNSGSSFVDSGNKKMVTMATQLEENDYTKYDGVVVAGSDVISFIKSQISQDAEICVEVITSSGNTAYLYTDGTLATKSTAKMASTTSKKSSAYINPTGSFLGAITRNAAGAITYISFTQQ